MLSEMYLLRAKSFSEMVNSNYDPIEYDTRQLFYWVTHLLDMSLYSVAPIWSRPHFIKVELTEWFYENAVLRYGQLSLYGAKVKGKDFYTVMNNVSNIFNELGNTIEGIEFSSECVIPDNEHKCVNAYLTVKMVVL